MARKSGGGTDFLDALPNDGERRLRLAVLIDAVRLVQKQRPSGSNLRVTRAWLRERAWFLADDPQYPFSFVSICGALGLDAGYVRRCALGKAGLHRVNKRRYAACVEGAWLQQRKDRIGSRPLTEDACFGRVAQCG